MAANFEQAEKMVATCRQSGTPFFVHENFRWQAPMRAVKYYLDAGHIGTPFRARIDMISGFPVFKNQPALAELEQFILTDLGSHILDLARFFFGEAESLYCQTNRIHRDIRGEDVATVVLRMNGGRTTVICEMAYAENPLEREHFPETLLFIEGDKGSLELAPGFQVRLTTKNGTEFVAFRHACTTGAIPPMPSCSRVSLIVIAICSACTRHCKSRNHRRRQPSHDASSVRRLRLRRPQCHRVDVLRLPLATNRRRDILNRRTRESTKARLPLSPRSGRAGGLSIPGLRMSLESLIRVCWLGRDLGRILQAKNCVDECPTTKR